MSQLPLVLIAGGILGTIVLVVVLRFLQKKLRIFTKGTVTFMVVVLMGVTVISTFNLLHGYRLAEQRVRREARMNTVNNFVWAWLGTDGGQQPREAAIRDAAATAPEVVRDVGDVEQEIRRQLIARNAKAESPADLVLVAVSVSERPGYEWRSRMRMEWAWGWKFSALYDDGRDFHVLSGRVVTTSGGDGPLEILGVEGQLERKTSHDFYRAREVHWYANVYRNKAYSQDRIRERYKKKPRRRSRKY